MQKPNPITYFESEGSDNLPHVVKILKKTLERRIELRTAKLVFLTAEGRGPAMAYSALEAYDPKIIAVTFAPRASGKKDGKPYTPRIPEKARKFFDGVEIPILSSRLPFDALGSWTNYAESKSKIIVDTLGLFGGSIPLAVQAVLQACDMGYVEIGELVFAVTGDCVLLLSASSTAAFLTPVQGLVIHEILCKPRSFTITRQSIPATSPLTLEGSKSSNEENETRTDRLIE
jgi:hypothetical protein